MKYFKDIKLKELSLQKILEKMNKTPHVAVGILQDKKVEGSFSIADLAAVHEYGSSNGHIPARSFIRSTFDTKQKKYAKLISDLQSKTIFENLTIKQALLTLGEVVSKDMVATINKGIKPPLKESTLKRKAAIFKKRKEDSKPKKISKSKKKSKPKKPPKVAKPKKRKKSLGFTPLIDTGRLKGSITHEIREGAI